MAEQFQFDPAPVDRAIARLNKLLEQVTRDAQRVGQLGHVTRPGDAPDTLAFHGKLTSSMSRLADQHHAFAQAVEAQIERLQLVKQQYTKTDQSAAAQLGGYR
ncbi:hypothetical protein [Amycolatopsis taiwanensis]|uniref:hypothetical protein n=1 Tax=Amycolatopsis taiwanensis TaxID=342230 RepID=UPI0004850FA3|nr:hypothetical protein [Amycolatopsis taiwanensis]